MLHRIITLVIKELQALFRDPEGRKILIIPVLLQLILFPAAATLEVRNNTLAILNQDSGKEAHELIQRFAQAKAFTSVLMLESETQMRETINARDALLVLQFPPDFSRQLLSGRSPVIQAILDGRRSNSGQIAFGYLQEIVQNFSSERLLPGATMSHSSVVVRHWFNPNLEFHWFIVPSLVAIITTTSTLVITALSVAREREQGTFDQLLVSPLTAGMVMLGKAIPASIVAMSQATIILIAGVFVYHIPFQGSLLLLYGSMVLYIFALVGFGLFISSICGTQQQAFLGVFSFMMPAILLSGFTSPIENMPNWLQIVTWINPLRHFIIIVKGVFLKDLGTSTVVANAWPLLVIGTVTLTFATITFRRQTS